MIVFVSLCAFGCLMSFLVMGLAQADKAPAPTIDTLKARYTAALSRGDTRGQKDALVNLKAARTAQLRREVGR